MRCTLRKEEVEVRRSPDLLEGDRVLLAPREQQPLGDPSQSHDPVLALRDPVIDDISAMLAAVGPVSVKQVSIPFGG